MAVVFDRLYDLTDEFRGLIREETYTAYDLVLDASLVSGRRIEVSLDLEHLAEQLIDEI